MLSKRIQKYIVSLHQSKFRQKFNQFIAQGPKICLEILQSNVLSIEYIFCTKKFAEQHAKIIDNSTGNISIITNDELKKISTLNTPNEILIVAHIPEYNIDFHKNLTEWSLFLDNVQEPGNVGTILRIADWFGISQVFLGEGCASVYNPKVIQSTMGAFLRVKTLKIGFTELLQESGAADVKSYACVVDGDNYKTIGKPPGIIIIGNESKGIQNDILNASTNKISIPRIGQAESLNASIACGIVCAEFVL